MARPTGCSVTIGFPLSGKFRAPHIWPGRLIAFIAGRYLVGSPGGISPPGSHGTVRDLTLAKLLVLQAKCGADLRVRCRDRPN